MSDFDKEAEREKLREKFERDKQKRKQSERMSELLLKGATMTNKHHDCGSPIFRWQGEEFCPSCEATMGADAAAENRAESGDADAAGGGSEAAGEAAEVTSETGGDAATDGKPADEVVASGSATTEIDVTAEPTTSATNEDGVDAETGEPTTAGSTPAPEPTRPPARDAADTGSAGEDATTDVGAAPGTAVGDARASLERTLADVARQAEETSTADLTHKRNLIAAAREAAEALEATRRAARQ